MSVRDTSQRAGDPRGEASGSVPPVPDGHTPAVQALLDQSWVVIAAFNESTRIASVLDGVLGMVGDVVVVDDGSADETIAQVLTRPVWLLAHPTNLGQGAALQTGIDFALSRGAGYIITFDADGQHRPHDIPALLSALSAHRADFALGSRFLGSVTSMPRSRRLMLRLAVLFARIVSGVKLTDAHNGLRAMTRDGARRIRIRFNRMEHASEIIDQIARSGLKYVEVPVQIRYTADTLAKGQRTSAAIGLGIRILFQRLLR